MRDAEWQQHTPPKFAQNLRILRQIHVQAKPVPSSLCEIKDSSTFICKHQHQHP